MNQNRNSLRSHTAHHGLLLLALAAICTAGLSGCVTNNSQPAPRSPVPLAPWEISVMNGLPADGARERHILPEQRRLLEQGRYLKINGKVASIFEAPPEDGRYRLTPDEQKNDGFIQQDRVIRLKVPEYRKK